MEVDQLEVQEIVDSMAYRKQKRNEQSIIALEEKVNYIELMAHIQNNHPSIDVPTDSKSISGSQPPSPFRSFSLCDELGFLAPCFPCCKKDKPTLMAQKIGLGPSLFLMSTKAFAWFFLAITVLNIPVIAFFASGNQAGDFNSLPDVFAILSMGNVGQSGFACNSVKMEEFYERDPKAFGYSPREQLQQYQRYSAININCGIGSKINSLLHVGLSRNETSSCKDMLENTQMYNRSFMDECYYMNSSRNYLFEYETVPAYKKSLEDNSKDTTVKDDDKYSKQIEAELECVKDYEDTGSFDFLQTWFDNYCVNKSSCRIPGMTQSAGYTYAWDVEKDDNKPESGKFVIFPRYDWGGYRIKD